ncbi:MAG TPA: alanine--tRNA ligase [Gaiellaceae bacterium]
MRTSAELREGYLSYFQSKGHLLTPSSSLVPAAYDPSVLLTTAGMQPLMPYFLGLEQPPAPRLASVQKCFRTTDIDEVGATARHLTFFEMLGNFSFGDYFKDGAIDLAWEFVTGHMKLDPAKLWATVYRGNPAHSLGPDEAAIAAWERVGIPSERIVRLGEDNFWSAGPTGPCGPCSEIYYDMGPELGCGKPDCAPGCSCDRYLEFWNLVFTEFEQHSDGRLTPLPRQNIDTGMGLERGSVILQGAGSVYEIDSFQEIMDWVAEASGTRYGESEAATKAHRVVADHGRGMVFLAAEGVKPGNLGRSYILRRVIRRAVQHGSRLGLEAPFLSRLAEVVIEQMGGVYPELKEHSQEIAIVLSDEEERFSQTLDRGMRLFTDVAKGKQVSGDDAFKLHDTYGFPVELTRELAGERGMSVDEKGFAKRMEEQRERSRAGVKGENLRVAEFSKEAGFKTEFVGYEKTELLTQIGALEEIAEGLFIAKLRESPFYPEGGGQIGDQGFIESEEAGADARAEIEQTFRFEDDQALLFRGEGFKAGYRVRAAVLWSARFPTMANHTATHLLHKALQQVLGEHARQAGSAVRPEKLRFDFSHDKALTAAEREEIERLVNEDVFANHPVHTFVTPIAEAKELGAMALFGEKYGDMVRVVEVQDVSRELCGGTHVRSSAEIGAFVITSEGSIGSGLRRIEAVTSGAAVNLLRERAAEGEKLQSELERVRKEAKKRPSEAGGAGPEIAIAREEELGGVKIVVAEVKGVDAEGLLAVSDQLKNKNAPAAVVVGAVEDGRVNLVCNFDKSLEERGLDAVAVVRAAAALVGGGGGGRAGMARAGGKDPAKLPEALQAAAEAILSAL